MSAFSFASESPERASSPGNREEVIARRLDALNWRLLDLTPRNRLLSFDPTIGPQTRSPHGIRYNEPGCDMLWERVVRLGKSQRFSDSALSNTDLFDRPPLQTDEIRTEPVGPRLNRALANMQSGARTGLEATGVTTLYLAFGFLRWSDDNGAETYAPLLLVPVELRRVSARDEFQLKRQNEEVLLNPALRYKLESDFAIALPAAPAPDDKSLLPYLKRVQQSLEHSPRAQKDEWCVLDWVYLGLFSSHQMAMFRDVRDHRSQLLKHPLMRALGDGNTKLNPPDVSVPSRAETAALSRAELELLLDADSYQQEAILAAQHGLSFVLQGPPGTGKSQTIANIIAQSLKANKRVLFVSEKLTALDVVHRRLQASGLGDFCLEAHSVQANKSAIVAELARTAQLSPVAPLPASHNGAEFESLQQRLNSYATELHHTHPRAQLSPHEVMGELAKLRSAPLLHFDFVGDAECSSSAREALAQWLHNFERLEVVWGDALHHPWRDLRPSKVDLNWHERESLRFHLQQAASLLHDIPRLGTQNGSTRRHELEAHLAQIAPHIPGYTAPNVDFERANCAAIASDFENKLANFHRIEEWLAYRKLHIQAQELGLSLQAPHRGLWEELRERQERGNALEGRAVVSAFWSRFWRLWLSDVIKCSPTLQTFKSETHETAIARFAQLDRERQLQAQEQLRASLSTRKPATPSQTPRIGQSALLSREAAKSTKHLAVRALFGHIAELVQFLKPCLLMSPRSVAQFLPLGRMEFDLVVFDEASQITPEAALGTIARGQQIIVVGDSQQMPPSDSLTGGGEGQSDDSNDEMSGLTSILDFCVSQGMPQKKLRYHYRSHSEELIAFSNRHFYNSELITFPAPATPRKSERSLTWEQVDGFCIPDATTSAPINPIEARRLAERAVEHARTKSHHSLGIITFNEAQRSAVETEIVRLTRNTSALHTFFWKQNEERFFLKTLDNVQGDERDVILISFGFGPRRAADGSLRSMPMNFGPISRPGGERCLNVAITRARQQVHLVTSFAPAEIDLTRAKSEGARLLRTYLEWAREGVPSPSSHADSRRTFPESIADALTSVLQTGGWTVHREIGLSENRVDIAVENPTVPGEILLGILCDGNSYKCWPTARDRDLVRPQGLERLGWHLYRIWSPDWVRNPDQEIARVLEALRRAYEAKSHSL